MAFVVWLFDELREINFFVHHEYYRRNMLPKCSGMSLCVFLIVFVQFNGLEAYAISYTFRWWMKHCLPHSFWFLSCVYILLPLIQMDSSLPPVQKLVVPAAASVSGNRSVSFRPTLTPGGASRPLDRTPRETVRNAVLHNITPQHCSSYIKCRQIESNTNLMLNLLPFYSLSPQDNHRNYLKQPQVHL